MRAPTTGTVDTRHITIDGMTYQIMVAGDGPPLLLLHGFTGSAATWMPFVPALARHARILAVDLPGHGGTEAPDDVRFYTMSRLTADLPAICDVVAPGQPRLRVLGYSMGGRAALHLACAVPEHVSALVLESASPGIADPAERAARACADHALADRIEREGVHAFVAQWENLPLFAGQRRLPPDVWQRQREQRLANRPDGLANSLRGMGAGAQESLTERLHELAMPALLLAGALDEKYRTLAAMMASRIPRARAVIVPDAGHAVHLEQPATFEQVVTAFLTTGTP
jgi:2-succinyl-6-hydroxy-2,4-cyclohexadiene-1-carboxylate synthase